MPTERKALDVNLESKLPAILSREVFLYSSAHDLSRVRSEGACGRFPAGPGRISPAKGG